MTEGVGSKSTEKKRDVITGIERSLKGFWRNILWTAAAERGIIGVIIWGLDRHQRITGMLQLHGASDHRCCFHELAPSCSILQCARQYADARPMLNKRRSPSTVRIAKSVLTGQSYLPVVDERMFSASLWDTDRYNGWSQACPCKWKKTTSGVQGLRVRTVIVQFLIVALTSSLLVMRCSSSELSAFGVNANDQQQWSRCDNYRKLPKTNPNTNPNPHS